MSNQDGDRYNDYHYCLWSHPNLPLPTCHVFSVTCSNLIHTTYNLQLTASYSLLPTDYCRLTTLHLLYSIFTAYYPQLNTNHLRLTNYWSLLTIQYFLLSNYYLLLATYYLLLTTYDTYAWTPNKNAIPTQLSTSASREAPADKEPKPSCHSLSTSAARETPVDEVPKPWCHSLSTSASREAPVDNGIFLLPGSLVTNWSDNGKS